jgi:hypothetical protein
MIFIFAVLMASLITGTIIFYVLLAPHDAGMKGNRKG